MSIRPPVADLPGMKITVTHDDGTEIDVTEGVQVAYDISRQSLDWGSGFLDLEEMEAISRLGEAARFPDFADALEDVQRRRVREEKAAAAQALREEKAEAERKAAQARYKEVADAMRAREPDLDPALSNESLFMLHRMRIRGLA